MSAPPFFLAVLVDDDPRRSKTLGPWDTALRPLPIPCVERDFDNLSAASSPVGFFKLDRPLGVGRCFGRMLPLSSAMSDTGSVDPSSKLMMGTVVVHFPLASN